MLYVNLAKQTGRAQLSCLPGTYNISIYCTVAYTLSRSERFSWQRRQKHLWIPWRGIAERSHHLVIKLSVHLLNKSVLYLHEGGQEEQKAVAGVKSDRDPGPLAAT